MFARRLVSLAILLGLLLGLTAPGVTPALAGADVCPEPNSDLASACFLGPGGPAPGFIDSPEDVDGYRIELPADSMIVGTLSGLPADYSLRLLWADASLVAEASEPGVGDKILRADGLPAGAYYLTVFSQRGESSTDQPYLVGVSYPASLVLPNPTAPVGGPPPGTYGYVPAPAQNYSVQPADVGQGYREIARNESADGRVFARRIVASDSVQVPDFNIWMSLNNIGMIDTVIFTFPFGSNEDINSAFDRRLNEWRAKGVNVEPAVGWGSEQVYSYALGTERIMYRGIALKHLNVVTFIEMLGLEQHATWEAISRLMRKVETRIWDAAQ